VEMVALIAVTVTARRVPRGRRSSAGLRLPPAPALAARFEDYEPARGDQRDPAALVQRKQILPWSFTRSDVIAAAVRWYLRYYLSYRDAEVTARRTRHPR
jgi:hypothetical protein